MRSAGPLISGVVATSAPAGRRGGRGRQADSDIDLLLDLPSGAGLFTLGRLRRELEDLLQAHVDLVPADGLKPEARAAVDVDLVAL